MSKNLKRVEDFMKGKDTLTEEEVSAGLHTAASALMYIASRMCDSDKSWIYVYGVAVRALTAIADDLIDRDDDSEDEERDGES